MKKLLPLLMAFITISAIAQTPCVGGFSGPYPCDGMDLQSSISLGDLDATKGNDSWGWVDPSNGNEYALMGLNNGTAFIDISDPINPVYLGKLPTHSSSSTWRDIKVYNNHAFVVSEANGHGMQVFDLTRLRSVANPPENFSEDAHYSGFGSAHNLVINEETGYAYGVGTSTYNGGPHFVNIQDPLNPVAAGGYALDSYSHDAQVITYCGPDSDYTGREIVIGSNENEIIIADITDKSNPVGISSISYSNVEYTHQGWFTEDQRYFIVGDEIDELQIGFNTRTLVFDFDDLDNPQFHFEYEGSTAAIDHNGYVKGTKYYMANYRAGIKVFDASDIANGNFIEESYFDTYPENDSADFNGAWSVYPYLPSENIIISDIDRGFFLVRPNTTIDMVNPVAVCQDVTVSLDANGNASITPAELDNGSTDNSGNVYFIACDTTFDCSELGTTTVELEVYDDFGNRDFCTSTVTVLDEIAPVLGCPAGLTVGYNGGTFYPVPNFGLDGIVTATDNCSTSFIISQDISEGTELTDGVYTINFETEDASGNFASCSFQLTVDETLSIEDNELNNSVVIFPNPSSDVITISSKNQVITDITIFDLLGNKIYTESNINVENKVVNISSLNSGLYLVKINGNTTRRLIVK
jgi:choice-of-anchor B domain-containing protein